MNIPLFNQRRVNDFKGSLYGQAVRLSKEVRPVIAHTDINTGLWVEAREGFHPETAPYTDFKRWFDDATIKKSPSLFWHIMDIMIIRFPEKHTEIRNRLPSNYQLEFDITVSELTNQVEDFGKRGYQNLVRRDGSLTNPKSKTLKLKNDIVKTVRK